MEVGSKSLKQKRYKSINFYGRKSIARVNDIKVTAIFDFFLSHEDRPAFKVEFQELPHAESSQLSSQSR